MQDLHNERTKTIGMAIGAGIIAAVATMFVPTSMLEALTGATGLSELVPATAAPLGDKARAIIAFATGAVTLALAIGLLSRSSRTLDSTTGSASSNKTPAEGDESESMPLLSQLQQRLGAFKAPKMPWARNEASNDVFELSDLPQLRTQDAHPDTPRRRPISAASDFGDIGLDGKQVYVPDVPLPSQRGPAVFDTSAFADAGDMAAQIEIQTNDGVPFFQEREMECAPADFGPSIDFESGAFETEAFEDDFVESAPFSQEFVASQPDPIAPATAFVAEQAIVPDVDFVAVEAAANDSSQPSLAELVAKFEAAVARRTEQLAALESLATRLASQTVAAEAAPDKTESQPHAEFQPAAAMPQPQEFEPVKQAQRPPLEAVPSVKRSDSDDDMDAALNAALATLQRMNAK
jgi:hypothetical protein